MDSNSRGLKRAKTVRTEYLKDVDDVQRWLQEAEVKVQDRSSEPKTIKDHIQVCTKGYKLLSLVFTILQWFPNFMIARNFYSLTK